MPCLISVGASKHMDVLRERLGRKSRLLEGVGINLKLEENMSGNFTFLTCSAVEGKNFSHSVEETKLIILHAIAEAISELILTRWEKVILFGIIKDNYNFLNKEEIKSVYELTLLRMANIGKEDFNRIKRKKYIIDSLKEFLLSHNYLNVDGFIHFRLKEYVQNLRNLIDRNVTDFLMEREYREFIKLLRYFMSLQEPQIEVVHVLVNEKGTFNLYDQDFGRIKHEYLEDFIMDLNENEINYEDILISALITIAPSQLVLHTPKTAYGLTKHTVDTIYEIFSKKVKQCNGCNLCRE